MSAYQRDADTSQHTAEVGQHNGGRPFEQVGGEAAALLQEDGRSASSCGRMVPPRRRGCWSRLVSG
jgi:hypothetical protein